MQVTVAVILQGIHASGYRDIKYCQEIAVSLFPNTHKHKCIHVGPEVPESAQPAISHAAQHAVSHATKGYVVIAVRVTVYPPILDNCQIIFGTP